MGREPGLGLVGIDHADLLSAHHRGDQGRLAGQPRGADRRAGIAGRHAGQAFQLPGVGGDEVGALGQLRADGRGDLGGDVEALAGVTHHRVDDDDRPAGALLARRGAHRVDGAGRGPDLGGGGEIAGDHQVGARQDAVGFDAIDHALEGFDRGRRSARRAPAGVASIEHRRRQHWIDLELGQGQGLHRAADTAGRDMAGQNQGGGHGPL